MPDERFPRCPECACQVQCPLHAAAPDLLAALDGAPLPSVRGTTAEFVSRFVDWWEGVAKPAMAKAEFRAPEEPRTPYCDRCDSDECQHCPSPSDTSEALTARERQ